MPEENQTLARGIALDQATFDDFVTRLRHHCRGQGVSNHCTADAIFLVERSELIYGLDTDFTDNRVVTCDDSEWFSPSEYWEDCDKDQRAELNRKSQEHCSKQFMKAREWDQWEILSELDDHNVYGWDQRWTFVNMHFTQEAAEAFIKRKKHDYPKGLRVYVDAQSYCWEFNAIKEALMGGRLVLSEPAP